MYYFLKRRNIMKTKYFAFTLILTLLLSMVACGTPVESSTSSVPEAASVATEAPIVEAPVSEEPVTPDLEQQADSAVEASVIEEPVTETPAPEPFVPVESPTIEELQAAVPQLFTQHDYQDAETGLSLSYNLYLPEGYSENESYPLVMFIPDSTCVGQSTEAVLQHYGCLIWASEAVQQDHPCIVLAPMYPQIIIDDHGSYTTTDYILLTRNLILSMTEAYSVDTNRIYGTGQSMGAMTTMYLEAQHPDLFAACLIVDGQWNVTDLMGLKDSKMFYFAAEGDDRAYAGMQELQPALEEVGAVITSGKWNATWDVETMHAALDEVLSAETDLNFIVWELGSVMPEGMESPFGEHMFSFVHPYNVHGVREWLLSQSAE